MRKALDKLLEYAIVHDIAESAAMTGAGTLIHAANGMDPEEAAIAAGLGFTTGMVTRPFGRAGGNFIGRKLDDVLGPADASKASTPGVYNFVMNMIPGSRQGIALNESIINNENIPKALRAISNAALPIQKVAREAFNKKANEQAAKEGRVRGLREEDAALIGRFFSDNLANAAMYLVGPALGQQMLQE